MTPALPDGLAPGGRFGSWRPAAPAYVVADVDGTLVGPRAEASSLVEDAVRRAQAADVRFGFATGRMRLAVEPLWAQLLAVGPHLLHNGAEVRVEGRTVASCPLETDHLAAVLEISRRLDAYVEVYVADGYLVSHEDERARPHWELLGRPPLGVAPPADRLHDEVLKVTFACFDGVSPDPIVHALEEVGLRAGPAGSPLTPSMTYVNGTHPDADKGRALGAAAAWLDLDLARVAAIGDAENDLPLFEVAGTAVAMGQAPAAVREAAHLVAPDVDADGVAVALDALLALPAGAGR